ncbi:MAG TPA: RES family NAD+ phosphorylase [Blastocatellia bacterium]|nr:RES family NAD+ phosphorylase [Blastocatellia bacterium]
MEGTVTMGSRHPDPPSDLATKALPIETLPNGTAIFRIHRTALRAKFFGRSSDWRFNSPDGSYGTLYAAISPEAAFAETLLRGRGTLIAESELKERSCCTFTITRELRLVRLHGPSMTTIGATAAVTAGPYAVSQGWSSSFFYHPDVPDGILYRATHDKLAVALFDRAQDAIGDGVSAPLLSDPTFLGGILDHYGAALK